MAAVRDIRVHADTSPTSGWYLSVSYRMEFAAWEAATWFEDVVEIVAVEAATSRWLARFEGPPFQALAGPDKAFAVARASPTIEVPAHQLAKPSDVEVQLVGVDATGHVVEGRSRIVVGEVLEARVTVVPLLPRGCVARTEVELGQLEAQEQSR